jgi:hypothetical protein
MAHKGTLITALSGCLLAGGAPVVAQTIGVTTGAVNGKVSDLTGAVLPGVVVVISGDAMIRPRAIVTDARGCYEVPFVPPGTFALEFSSLGFKSVRHEGVPVNLGGTTTVDAVLELEGGRETVDVSGRAPVDRSGTAITFSLDAQQLADLPASRGMGAIYAATPGILLTRFDVGGNAAIEPGPYSAFGTSRPEQPTLEGISITSHHPLGFTLDYGSFEHVSVRLGAFGPELPWPGAQVQIITKSGGSRYHGSLYLDYENRNWQGSNIDLDQIQRDAPGRGEVSARDANRLWGYRDGSIDAGGPLKKGVLWGYFSLRDQELSTRQVRFPVKAARTWATNLGGKATAQAGSNRFVAFGQATWNRQPTRLGGFLSPSASVHHHEDSTTNQAAQGGVWKVEWNAPVRKNFLFEVLGGQFIAGRHERPNHASSYRFEDRDLTVSGGNRDWETTWRRDQIVGSAIFEMTGAAGSHSVKLGGSIERFTPRERWYRGYLDDVLHVTQSGRPAEVYLFQTPSESVGGLQLYAAHLNDSWRVTDRFTLNVGLRFDRYRVFLPAQEHPAGRSGNRSWRLQTFDAVNNLSDWNVVAPRLGVSQVLTGDGRTVLKVTYGQYWLPPGIELLFNANPNSREWWERSNWVDADGNGRWDIGEDVDPLETRDRRGGTEIESLDSELRLEFTREVTARIEREIVPNMRLETGVVWRGQRQPFVRQNESQPFGAYTRVVPINDPGIDGVVGTADDRAMVVYDLPESAPLPSYSVRNVPNAPGDTVTWEVTAERRLHRRWSLVAGFSHTWARDQSNAYFGQAVRANVYPLTPNDLINTGEDGRHEFRVWTARAYGTYEAPWGLRITPFLRHQSGQPYGRTFVVRNLNQGTSLPVLAEPIGTRRMDNVTLFDVRVEKTFTLGPGRRVSPFVDAFNLFNANPEQNLNWSSGAFQRPLAIVPPRIARIGLKLAW